MKTSSTIDLLGVCSCWPTNQLKFPDMKLKLNSQSNFILPFKTVYTTNPIFREKIEAIEKQKDYLEKGLVEAETNLRELIQSRRWTLGNNFYFVCKIALLFTFASFFRMNLFWRTYKRFQNNFWISVISISISACAYFYQILQMRRASGVLRVLGGLTQRCSTSSTPSSSRFPAMNSRRKRNSVRKTATIEDIVEPRKVKHVTQTAAGMGEWIGSLDNVRTYSISSKMPTPASSKAHFSTFRQTFTCPLMNLCAVQWYANLPKKTGSMINYSCDLSNHSESTVHQKT